MIGIGVTLVLLILWNVMQHLYMMRLRDGLMNHKKAFELLCDKLEGKDGGDGKNDR